MLAAFQTCCQQLDIKFGSSLLEGRTNTQSFSLMIARLLIFAIASLAGSICLPNDLEIKIRLDGKHVLSADYRADIDSLLKSNLSTLVFRRAEYISPYRDTDGTDMQGKISVEIVGLSEVSVQSLHLLPAPEATLSKWCDPNWKLHPDDIAAIAELFKSLSIAPDHDYFDIKINGIDSFRGALFEKPSQVNLAGIVSSARVMTLGATSRNYIYPTRKNQDLIFFGDVEISFNGLSPIRLHALRLVYAPGEEDFLHVEEKAWKLTSEDGAQIASLYQPILRQQRWDARVDAWNEHWNTYSPTIGRLIALALLFWLLGSIVKKRIERQQQPRRSAATQTYWWDE